MQEDVLYCKVESPCLLYSFAFFIFLDTGGDEWKKKQTNLNEDQEGHVFPETGIKQLTIKPACLAKFSLWESQYKIWSIMTNQIALCNF